MIRLGKLSAVSAVVLAAAGLWAAPAAAQATRTWVSGVGDDLNPCSRTAPCKTFAGAINKTAAGGEINCLDPGAFGAVTITKSMSIVCQYTEAGTLATLNSNGIVVNAGPNDVVYLSGLDLFGAGTGLNGVRFVAGAELHIENSLIRRFANASGHGVSFQPNATSRLFISRTTISNNGNGATGGGILIQPTGGSGNARVTLHDVNVVNNANNAISVNTTGAFSGLGVSVDIVDSRLVGSTNGLLVTTPVGATFARVNIAGSAVIHNNNGLSVSGSNALIRASGNLISNNGFGMTFAGGGQIFGYGDNVTDGNQNPSTFTAGSPLGKN
jgi:hypothetical protein